MLREASVGGEEEAAGRDDGRAEGLSLEAKAKGREGYEGDEAGSKSAFSDGISLGSGHATYLTAVWIADGHGDRL